MARLFVGWKVPDEAAAGLAALSASVRAAFERKAGRARWERPAKLHATLHFLGEMPDDRIPLLSSELVRVAAARSSFPIVFSGVGAFPPRGRPRVLFASIGEGGAAFIALATAVQETLARAGAPVETKPFHPHVTLARVKDAPRGRWEWDGTPPSIPARVESIALYASTLAPGGAVHTPIVTAPLSG